MRKQTSAATQATRKIVLAVLPLETSDAKTESLKAPRPGHAHAAGRQVLVGLRDPQDFPVLASLATDLQPHRAFQRGSGTSEP